MPEAAALQVGARVAVGADRGTVRYVGAVAGGAAGVYVGVVWDRPGRGKHDGQPEPGGPRYFTCAYGVV
jgi:dynactin complex subunit